MSDKNYRGYDLNNFDDNKREGKHFKEETPVYTNDNFDDFTLDSSDNLNIENEEPTADYGDDFYSSSSSFEPEEEEEFNPVISRQSYSRGVPVKENESSKKKNIAIIVLSITLAVVIFIFSLVVFLGSDKKDDKKPTVPSTTASETVEKTEPTVEETDAPTEAPTEAPTDPPTEAPTDPPTEAPTDPPTEAMTEDLVPDDIEGDGTPELIS